MSTYFYLSEEPIERIRPFFPLAHGVPHVREYHVLMTGVSSVVSFMFSRVACNGGTHQKSMALTRRACRKDYQSAQLPLNGSTFILC